jgi:hypothetical protein
MDPKRRDGGIIQMFEGHEPADKCSYGVTFITNNGMMMMMMMRGPTPIIFKSSETK